MFGVATVGQVVHEPLVAQHVAREVGVAVVDVRPHVGVHLVDLAVHAEQVVVLRVVVCDMSGLLTGATNCSFPDPPENSYASETLLWSSGNQRRLAELTRKLLLQHSVMLADITGARQQLSSSNVPILAQKWRTNVCSVRSPYTRASGVVFLWGKLDCPMDI